MIKFLKWGLPIVLSICLMLVMAGCAGSKAEVQNGVPASSKSAQSQSEQKPQGEVTLSTGSEMKWPKELMGDLPEPEGKVTAVLHDEAKKQCTVAFGEMSKSAATAYIEQIKKLGYTGGMNMTNIDMLMINGENTAGVRVDFIYNTTAQEGTITYTPKDEASSGSGSAQTPVDMTDLAEWPANYLKGVPELSGKIVDLVKQGDSTMFIDLEYVDKADFASFVKTLKENGYTLEADETSSLSAIDYRAYNADGDYINAYWTAGEEKNTASITLEKAD